MKDISQVASKIQGSSTLKLDAMYKQMLTDGKDVVGFGVGEPDFDTPDNIKDAAHVAISEGKTKYTPASGMQELRLAIAERLRADCNLDYSPSQIVVASGAKHSIYVALNVLLNPGDEVIVPAPYWLTYTESIKMAGGVPVIIDTKESNDFKITPDQLDSAITDKTKLFILCNPSNPTGMLYDKNELSDLAKVCLSQNLYIMSDEIYHKLVYDGKEFTSFAQLGDDIKERTIVVNGVSKSYAMTGWRIGYTASSVKIAGIMGNYLSHSTSAPSTISQIASIEALRGSQDRVLEMCSEFERRRDYICERIDKVQNVSCRKPDGAFYVMLNIEKLIGKMFGGMIINNSDDFVLSFLENGLVATVSCTDFGCDNFVRLSYATSMEMIKKGMDRLEVFLRD